MHHLLKTHFPKTRKI